MTGSCNFARPAGRAFEYSLRWRVQGAPNRQIPVRSDAVFRGPDRTNVIGLHHLALTVASDSLDTLYERLQGTTDVSIEFAPEPLGDMPVRHMMCNIPGGIRVEFLAPNA